MKKRLWESRRIRECRTALPAWLEVFAFKVTGLVSGQNFVFLKVLMKKVVIKKKKPHCISQNPEM